MAKGQLRKGRWAIAGFACLAAIASAPLAINSLQGNGISLAALDPAKKLSDLLDARSPGERVKGELAQTKIKKKKALAGRRIQPGVPAETPQEKLAQVIVPKEAETPLVPPAAAEVPLVPPAAAESIVPASFAPLSAAPLVIGGGVLGGGGGGNGGGGGGGGSPPPTTTPPVTTPVPEPSTWLMMLLGFGMVGAASRRRQSAAQPIVA